MRLGRMLMILCLLGGALDLRALAASFSMFPRAGRLVSPDGRFEVRNADREGSAGDYAGIFHSLWLTEVATGNSRKLCDYVGIAAVAWSSNDFLVVTQYLSKKTSRALVFAAASAQEPLLIDTSTLIQRVPVELRPTLRENDHSFVEASRLEGEIFYFGVWGYGKHDPDGYRWSCRYSLSAGELTCTPTSKASVRN